MPTPFIPRIKSATGGNVMITTANAALTDIALEVAPLGVSTSKSQAPIKLNGSVTFNLAPGKWIFWVHFRHVNAPANFDVLVRTAQNPAMIPAGPLHGSTQQYNQGLLPFLVHV